MTGTTVLKYFYLLFALYDVLFLLLCAYCVYVCLRVDVEQHVFAEEQVWEDPEQQFEEGKCSLTYLCPFTLKTYFPAQLDSNLRMTS